MDTPQTTRIPATAGAGPLIVDALGSLANPNLDDGGDPVHAVDARALDDAIASGLAAIHQTVGYVSGDGDPYHSTHADLDAWDHLLERNGDRLHRVLVSDDIRQARRSGRIGVIYGFQNGTMLAPDPGRAAEFARRGVRIVQLTYNGANPLGDGAMAPENRGLTDVGHAVVEALNHAGLAVDLSHSGERTCLDAVNASREPVIISHTGCRALADLPRNKTDAELRAVADRGGLVGIYFMPFLAIGRQPTALDLIAHLEHAIDVCGDEHVCIGTDGAAPGIDDLGRYRETLAREVAERRASGISATGECADVVPFLPDLEGPGRFRRLAGLLEARGHRGDRIERILGGNFLRYARGIWG
ncbi:MAG: membrane dipeptidase [Steroidobacteraceae bacterium]